MHPVQDGVSLRMCAASGIHPCIVIVGRQLRDDPESALLHLYREAVPPPPAYRDGTWSSSAHLCAVKKHVHAFLRTIPRTLKEQGFREERE